MYVRRAGTDRPDAKRILSALIQRQPLSQNRHQDLCAAKISWTTHDCVHSRAALGSWCVLLSALLRRGTRQASLSTPQYIVNAHDLILAGSNNENTLPAFPEKRAESIALPFSRSMPACHSGQVQDPDHHGNSGNALLQFRMKRAVFFSSLAGHPDQRRTRAKRHWLLDLTQILIELSGQRE